MGVILGTAAYMAPEQAKGKLLDRRADIWAFGCVLFEMLTGRMAFAREDITETLAAVMRDEPDWNALPGDAPPSIIRLLRRCLTKDVKERLSDIGVARLEIRDATDRSHPDRQPQPSRARTGIRGAWWLAPAALLVGAMATAVVAWMVRPAPRALPALSLTLDWPDDLIWAGPSGPGVALSPGGTQIAYLAAKLGEAPRLFVQALNDDQRHEVPGSDRAYSAFFSPDGTQIGFISNGKLWRATIAGGTPFEIGSIDQGDRGVAWSADGYIYSGGGNGLSRIAETGGIRESLTSVDRGAGEVAHRFPAIMPGGRGILFTIFKGGLDDARLAVLDLTTRKWRVVMDRTGHSAQYTSTGHLVYLRTGVLMAIPFDVSRLDVTGPPVPVLNGVLFNNGGAAHFSVANTGTLVYVPDPGVRVPTDVAWVDRAGRTTPVEIPRDPYRTLALSPDGTRVALERHETSARSTVVVWDFGRRALTPITRDAGLSGDPVWMPAGDSLVYASRPQMGSVARLFRQRADGVGNPAQISTAPIEQVFGSSGESPGSVSSDGTKVFYTQEATASNGVKSLDLATSRVEMLVASRGRDPRISPDGRWLAYGSTESGLAEIYVRPYPAVETARWPVSNGGGRSPRWSRDGRELFYQGIGVNQSRMFVVAVDQAVGFQAARPRVLFELPESRADAVFGDFDVAPDGRFLMLVSNQPKPPIPHVIVNWFETLKRTGSAQRGPQ
jgi:Tol biopolymer transport system component